MTTTPPSSLPPAIVLDASVVVSVTAREATTEAKANAEIARYLASGYVFFAPGLLVAETLYVLCGKLAQADLTAAEHARALLDFQSLLSFVLPPPNGDFSLMLRAEAIRGSYTCRRSADGIYIALAEELALTRQTTLLTLDIDMPKQARNQAPAVKVQVITP